MTRGRENGTRECNGARSGWEASDSGRDDGQRRRRQMLSLTAAGNASAGIACRPGALYGIAVDFNARPQIQISGRSRLLAYS